MTEKEALEKIQASLEILIAQNQTFKSEIADLKKDNADLRKTVDDKKARIAETKEKWTAGMEQILEEIGHLEELKEQLLMDNVEESFFEEDRGLAQLSIMSGQLGGNMSEARPGMIAKSEPTQELIGVRFVGTSKEERMECSFGEGGNYSAVAMRRFVDRYETVREMNMGLRITGWDDPKYRAGKITLCLKGDAFDYVKFASSMHEAWANNDELLLGKLKDKFVNIQTIEMNILEFEKSVQESRETIDEFMSGLKRKVRDAYDGDLQRELDRKVAWRFVSGLRDKNCRDKILEAGWMLNRQEAKPLEELKKIAEYAKRNEDTSKALGRSAAGGVAMFEEFEEEATLASFSRGNTFRRAKTPSTESKSSVESRASLSSSELPQDFRECFYCKKKHRGGWYHCTIRRKENPGWKPNRQGTERTSFR